jgi:hypothetical protein
VAERGTPPPRPRARRRPHAYLGFLFET